MTSRVFAFLGTLLFTLPVFALPAHALEVTFGAGTFTVTTTTYALGAQPLTIRGSGSAQTTLVLPAGFDITYTDLCHAPVVQGVTLVTQNANAGTALKIAGPGALTSTCQGPRISDVYVRGEDLTLDHWNRGIHLVDVWNPILRDVNIKGLDQPQPPFVMTTGIEYERTQVFDAEKLDVYHAQDAVKQSGVTYGEGASIRDFNLVGVNRGFLMLQGAGYTISDGHINAFQTGIELQGKSQLVIDGVLIYKTHYSSAAFVGILMVSTPQIKIVNSTIDGGWETAHDNSGTTYGIVMSVVSNSHVSGNHCTNFRVPSACIVVGFQSNNNVLTDNLAGAGVGSVVQLNPDRGPNNWTNFNKP